MGNKDYAFSDGVKATPKRKVHPVWRGIGCVFMVLNPIMAYAGMVVIMDLNRQNGWMNIPRDLVVEYKDPLILVKGILFLVLLFLLYAIFMMFTFLVERIAGPSRFGLYDVPPVWYRGKRYKR
jgi:hypothetical protein